MTTKRMIGVEGSSKGFYILELFRSRKKLIIVTPNQKSLEILSQDLNTFLGEENVFELPGWDTLPFEQVSPDIEITSKRIITLQKISEFDSWVCITTPFALIQSTIPPHIVNSLKIKLSHNNTFDTDLIVSKLKKFGFREVTSVESLGEFSIKGSVLDFFSSTTSLPTRIEHHQGIIQRISSFSTETQRTITPIESITILPLTEFLPADEEGSFSLHEVLKKIKDRGRLLQTPPREIAKLMSAARLHSSFPACELLLPLFTKETSATYETLPDEAQILFDDERSITEEFEDLQVLVDERFETFIHDQYCIPEKESLYANATETIKHLKSKHIASFNIVSMLSDSSHAEEKKKVKTITHFSLSTKLRTKIGTGDALQPLKKTINEFRKQKYRVAFIVGNIERGEKLSKILLEIGFDVPILLGPLSIFINDDRNQIGISIGVIHNGFELPHEKLVFISEEEIFGERSLKKKRSTKVSLKKILNSLGNLNEGDFVVHSDHGIAKYRGLQNIDVDDHSGDFLILEYADSKLYLPVHNISRVQKFVSQEGQTPQLDKLSNPYKWIKTKQKVRESVAALAGDLIRLYALRSVSKGWRYEPWGADDEKFAEEFQYTETEDQGKAILDTIDDLSKDTPMDRLVCGDVGFGKTEVAIRAAYKALQHARQIAVLVPTTILVEQHKRSFQKRLEGYPFTVEAVSRFYSPKKNKEVIEKLKKGEIDVVIGTHRLLSKDIEFKDLGLLIIDEEHRFGVKQKERLKSYRTSVDVLTLTATPIPRTLHMSLLGIRDISVIATPPVDRRTIRTYVAENDEQLLKDAILRELKRGGQVFFVHNRIPTLPSVMAELLSLVPEARMEFAHGQMNETELENIMQRFIEGNIDVLLSTTIVESGIDIPNANTIIINNAGAFGLAQLYQLRGRVGRSTRQAYCYFLVPSNKRLNFDAQRRLQALQSLDDLGLGFQLAVRDLEIRGAGNLLGKEQSGSVLSVGYELYSQILKEAVLNLKGEELSLSEIIEPEIKLLGQACIPDFYIPDISERLLMYQRLASIASNDDAKDILLEIEDRFGVIPPPLRDYIDLMTLRSLLKNFGILKAEQTESKVNLSVSAKAPLSFDRITSVLKSYPDEISLSKNLVLSIKSKGDKILRPGEILAVCEEIFSKIKRD